MLTLCLTCGSTGCSYCSVYYFGMRKLCNFCLCYCNGSTYGTMLTLGKTGFGTGRSLSCINYFDVTMCFTFGCSTCRTGLGCIAICRYPFMAECCLKLSTTYGTSLRICTIRLCTGGVTLCCFKYSITYGTSLCSSTSCSVTRSMAAITTWLQCCYISISIRLNCNTNTSVVIVILEYIRGIKSLTLNYISIFVYEVNNSSGRIS